MLDLAITLVSVGGGSIITYLLTIRKVRADTAKVKADTFKVEIDSMTAIVETWKKAALDLTEKVDELQLEVDKLKKYNKHLLKKIEEYEKTNTASHPLHGHAAGQGGE